MKSEILTILPARGGSKSIIKKNIRFLNGKLLICYQIQNALRSRFITEVVVTSDDEEILSYVSYLLKMLLEKEIYPHVCFFKKGFKRCQKV